jgi:hypothetical protein
MFSHLLSKPLNLESVSSIKQSRNVHLLIKAVTVDLVDHLFQRSQENVLHLVFSGGPFFETSLGEHCFVEVDMQSQDKWMTTKLLFSTPDHHVKQICHQFSLPLNHRHSLSWLLACCKKNIPL